MDGDGRIVPFELVATRNFAPEPQPDPDTLETVRIEASSLVGCLSRIIDNHAGAEVYRALYLHCGRLKRAIPRVAHRLPEYGPSGCCHDGVVAPHWLGVVEQLGWRTLARLRCLAPCWPGEHNGTVATDWKYAAMFAAEVMASPRRGHAAEMVGRMIDCRELLARLEAEERYAAETAATAPAGKPGRPSTTTDIAQFVREAREQNPHITWKRLQALWKSQHPHDGRKVTVESMRIAYRRHFSDE